MDPTSLHIHLNPSGRFWRHVVLKFLSICIWPQALSTMALWRHNSVERSRVLAFQPADSAIESIAGVRTEHSGGEPNLYPRYVPASEDPLVDVAPPLVHTTL